MIPGAEYSTSCRWAVFLFCLLFSPASRASNDNYPAGARAAAMGQTGVMYPDFWSIWHNQAGLGFYHRFSAGFHHENRFMLPEFGLNCVGITLPTSSGTFGLSWSYFGYSRYHENKFGLALGKSFHDRFAAGLQIDYLNTFIDDESGSSGTVAVEAGILAEPYEGLLVGFHVFNPTASAHTKRKQEPVPVIMRVGLGYRFDDRLFLGVETEKDLGIARAFFKLGLEYRLFEYIYVRTGISVQEYVHHSFGLGFRMQNFQADLAFSYQQIAGYTPYLSLQYVFK